MHADIAMDDDTSQPPASTAEDGKDKEIPIANFPGASISIELHARSINHHPGERSMNNLYPPSILLDYGGDLFQHEAAKLKQLDFCDMEDELITPDNWYSVLRQGMLVMVHATLHAFNYKTHRVSNEKKQWLCSTNLPT